jgi:predicted amidophosphoribosyltransferase
MRLDFAPGCLRRIRDTASQTELDASQRRRNVWNAFESGLPEWIDGRRLLLVDDVMTTGATLRECSHVLKDAGAAAVYVVTIGRG